MTGARVDGPQKASGEGEYTRRKRLNENVSARANSVFNNWPTIFSQGEASAGEFTGFVGQALTFSPLVDGSDKPGTKQNRVDILISFDPGRRPVEIKTPEITLNVQRGEPPLIEIIRPLPDYSPT
ncbi:MAG: hypothetical protein AAF922_01985 [Pseudomonadota bacterium]